jgi:hypothetical protein
MVKNNETGKNKRRLPLVMYFMKFKKGGRVDETGNFGENHERWGQKCPVGWWQLPGAAQNLGAGVKGEKHNQDGGLGQL